MAFACIYVPDFMVQSVVRAEPALRGHAIALISGTPPLWSVIAANSAALDAGIQLGMTKSQAAEFRAVQVCHRSESQEKAAHVALLDVAWGLSPRVEDTAPDTIVLDIDGLASLFGSDESIANELARRVSGIGLNPQIAIASKIEVAILAARGFPGITVIPEGEERRNLSGLPVNVLAASTEVLEILERWGVNTLQDLAALPILELSERLGQEGAKHETEDHERDEPDAEQLQAAVHHQSNDPKPVITMATATKKSPTPRMKASSAAHGSSQVRVIVPAPRTA